MADATATPLNAESADFTHPDYLEALVIWQTVDDVCEGPRRVKCRGEIHLPRLSDQTDADYKAYVMRAVFLGFTKRTREAMVGMMCRKRPAIALPGGTDTDQPLLADVTMTGLSIWQWIRDLASKLCDKGRAATVIDYSAENMRPYFATYRAEDVLNWASGTVDGAHVLTMLIVRETEQVVEDYTVKILTRFRAYRLVDGACLYRTWTTDDTGGYQTAEEKPLMRRGKTLTRIPAVIHNAAHLGPETGEAPLYDLAELNLSHYRTSADLENGRHIAGLPTPYATGIDSENKGDLRLGTTVAWTAEDPQAKFGFVEFTGQGLSELTKALEEKERQMAALGARMLITEKKEAEAFDTVKLRSSSETSYLANISGHMSVTATQAIRWFFWWIGTVEKPDEIDAAVVMSQDFIETEMQPAALQALVSAFQQNAISFETFFFKLNQGEMYPDDWDLEREAAAISQRPPSTMPIIQGPPGGDPPGKKPGEDKKDPPGKKPPSGGPGGNKGGKTADEDTKNK